jgi:hypothetical protein
MKKRNAMRVLFPFCIISFTACASFDTWNRDVSDAVTARVFVKEVSVYKTGGMASVEEELRAFTPVFLMKNRLLAVNDAESADLIAEIQAHEREYRNGWDTKRSISLMVSFFDTGGRLVAASHATADTGTLSDAEKLKRVFKKTMRLTARKSAAYLRKAALKTHAGVPARGTRAVNQ